MVGFVLLELALLLFALQPTHINSREMRAAHHKFIRHPTDENRREYEETARRVTRPFHLIQTAALAIAIAAPVALWFRRRIRSNTSSATK